MKVKNVVFSGFAAAMFATVCGAASAATVGLISKDYADSKLQGKLTAGDNIEISDNNIISTTGLVQSSDYNAKVEELEQSISDEATARGNADANLQTAIDGKVAQGDFNTLSSKVDGIDSAYKAADQGLQSEIDAVKALTGTEGVAQQIANAVSAETAARELADQNLQSAIDSINNDETGILKQAQNYADGLAGNYDAAGAANTALESAKAYADQEDAKIESTIGQVAEGKTVVQMISDAQSAAKSGAEATAASALNEYKTSNDNEVSALKGRVAANEGAIVDINAELDTMATSETVNNLTGRVSAAEGDIDALQAKDIELAGDIAANGTAISNETSARESADNALGVRITTLEGAGYQNASQVASAISEATADMFNGAASAGSYLVNFDASGNASYAPVEILDGQGAPYDLTSGAVQSK